MADAALPSRFGQAPNARDVLGWEPAVPLSEGLARTVDYFRGVVNS